MDHPASRIGVVGTGAIGGTLAALADRAGHDVVVTARGDGLARIAADGIRLTGAWGEHTARVPAVDALRRHAGAGFDLVVVTVKATDAEIVRDALEGVDARHVLVVQNGLGAALAASAALGRVVAGGLSLIAARMTEPGAVLVTAPGATVVGAADAGAAGDDRADGTSTSATNGASASASTTSGTRTEAGAVARLLDTVAPAEATDDLVGAEWSKLVVNQLNALPAVTGLPVQEVLAHRGPLVAVARAMQETVRVARAEGVDLAPLPGLAVATLERLARVPVGYAAALPAAMAAAMGAVPNLGSTLQSIRRGRPSEIDALTGAVVASGARTGVATPVCALLVELVHEVEATGRFLAPEDVGMLLANLPAGAR